MFFRNKKVDPIELEKAALAEAWSREELDSEKRQELIQRYKELDEMSFQHEKLRAEHGIDKKTLFTNGVTIGLALLTLNFERFDVLRSKVSPLWLRRREQ